LIKTAEEYMERCRKMSENINTSMDMMTSGLPGGQLRIALDDELTVLYASDSFYELIEMNESKQAKPVKSIFKTVYSADIIFYTQQIAAHKQKNSDNFMLFYRVLQKNGSLKWIMINGKKTDEVYQKQSKTYPVFSCVALDMSDHMAAFRRIEQELDYHRTIMELSRELFFEYLIAADTLTFTELFREVLGKESQIKDFSKRLEKTKVIHPEDLPGVLKVYKSIMGGKKQAILELRLKTKDGDIAWYICYASIIYDENKNPFKVVGKLTQVHTKQENRKEIPQEELDALTRVYTKESAETMITNSLRNQDPGDVSALFICEVRNYKGINEVVKIVEGENVLVAVSRILQGMFRTNDVIGRVGHGDFVIFINNIRSDRILYEKAETICREVDKLFSFDYNKNSVSISIGIALVKGPADYAEILANARSALVMAKKESKSSFEIFCPTPGRN